MATQDSRVRLEILDWLRGMAEKIRIGHLNNAPYAQPYKEAADGLLAIDFEPAIEIIRCHQENALNETNFNKYSNWLACLSTIKTVEIT